jgi:hypothetical protein
VKINCLPRRKISLLRGGEKSVWHYYSFAFENDKLLQRISIMCLATKIGGRKYHSHNWEQKILSIVFPLLNDFSNISQRSIRSEHGKVKE